ncbi:hypothetical protein LTR35_017224 [Friedmanniomyces endolithicus]|nr:hypothetical protein LTR35_017224 [Friedmanniomyces endolithicus]KAK0269543.1 hypothetical protein LTS00_017258 [Friedmanniomyces endolithicus]KAK0302241.1 hypothetical protein LTR01_008868 [Friedmanniomyces endolithicus]KAK0822897.1 hypothetical protein LTR73_008934 [Friedmanniomyces endolithicus]KAK0973101.1 hypothetical protein LTR54_017423 [Friedmanniomyces endolithicus]
MALRNTTLQLLFTVRLSSSEASETLDSSRTPTGHAQFHSLRRPSIYANPWKEDIEDPTTSSVSELETAHPFTYDPLW